MENGKADTTADKLEIVQVLGINARCGIDLEGIVVLGRVLEQKAEGVVHLVREEEEEFSAAKSIKSPARKRQMRVPRGDIIIPTFFTIELDHQPLLQIIRALFHDLGVTILKDMVSANLDLAVPRLGS